MKFYFARHVLSYLVPQRKHSQSSRACHCTHTFVYHRLLEQDPLFCFTQQYFTSPGNDKTIESRSELLQKLNNITMECSDIEDDEFCDCESEPEENEIVFLY